MLRLSDWYPADEMLDMCGSICVYEDVPTVKINIKTARILSSVVYSLCPSIWDAAVRSIYPSMAIAAIDHPHSSPFVISEKNLLVSTAIKIDVVRQSKAAVINHINCSMVKLERL